MRNVIVGAYNDALTPVFLYMVPIMLIATVLLVFVVEKPLATTLDRDALPESVPVIGSTDVVIPESDPVDDLDAEPALK